MRVVITIILILTFVGTSYSQKEASNWYFGVYAGITFNTVDSIPAPLTDGELKTLEGCATISDKFGNLLFYTDGITVWNKNHRIMKNGEGLFGHVSSTQSAIIIPNPGKKNQYYIFTVDAEDSSNGLNYSMVDMSLDSSRGRVIEKNTHLISPVTEKITAIKHNFDYWLIAHQWEGNYFLSYKITDQGISPELVISPVGIIHEGDIQNKAGYMKFSTDGKKLATAIYWESTVEIFDFDISTGVLSNPTTLTSDDFYGVYGIEFSPDATKLYVTKNEDNSRLYQINLEAGSAQEMLDTKVQLAKYNDRYSYGSLQLAPDGKIYLARNFLEYLSVIEEPDTLGWACIYVNEALFLNDKLCGLGLPTFIQSFMTTDCDITAFDYPDFSEQKDLLLNGNATFVSDFLRLSSNKRIQSGSAWAKNKIPVRDGFKTFFSFSISEGNDNDLEDGSEPGADGLAFVIQNSEPDALGDAGGGIGYAGIKNSLAIEFDTYANDNIGRTDFSDPNGNHIAVQCNGTYQNSADHSSKAAIAIADDIMEILPDKEYFVKIDYNIEPNVLRVFLDTIKNYSDPVLTVENFDINNLLDLESETYAFVGFTAATGKAWENHDIHEWHFCPTPVTEPVGIISNEVYNNEVRIDVYPNPFFQSAMINYQLAVPSHVALRVYNALGIEVAMLVNEFKDIGEYQEIFNAENYSQGLYYYTIQIGGRVDSGKMLLVR